LAGTAAAIFLLAHALGKARVVELLLADAGRREAAVVVCRVDQAIVRKREDLLAHRAIERTSAALLEIGAAAAADQHRVAGEGHRAVVEHVREAAVGVARRCARFQMALAEIDALTGLQVPVRALGAACCG